MNDNKWLKLGVVGRPRGLKGWFYVGGRLEPLPQMIRHVLIGETPEEAIKAQVLSNQFQSGRALIQVDLASTREAADSMKGQVLWTDRESLPVDDQVEYLWGDLIGKKVTDCHGELLGTVKKINNFGASDVVDIKDASGRKLSIPLVSAYFDMSFSAESEALNLIVPNSTFDESWE